jgi:hypothetical protein
MCRRNGRGPAVFGGDNARQDGDDEYVINRLVDMRRDNKSHVWLYRLSSEGFRAEDDTWEPEHQLPADSVTRFLRSRLTKAARR